MSIPIEELEDMIISRLFFGTLAEVASCVLDREEHLESIEDGNYLVKLTSVHMDRLLHRWHGTVTFFKGADYVRGSTQSEETVGYILDPVAYTAGRVNLPQPRGGPGQSDDVFQAELDAQGRSMPYERAFKCLQGSQAIAGLLGGRIHANTMLVVPTLMNFWLQH